MLDNIRGWYVFTLSLPCKIMTIFLPCGRERAWITANRQTRVNNISFGNGNIVWFSSNSSELKMVWQYLMNRLHNTHRTVCHRDRILASWLDKHAVIWRNVIGSSTDDVNSIRDSDLTMSISHAEFLYKVVNKTFPVVIIGRNVFWIMNYF